MRAHPSDEGGFVQGSRGEAQDGLRRVFFRGRKAIAVHFEEEHADDKAGALVAIHKGVVADNAAEVRNSHGYDMGAFTVGTELLRPRKSGLQQTGVAYALRAAVHGEEPVMQRKGVALVYPDRLPHLESACSV